LRHTVDDEKEWMLEHTFGSAVIPPIGGCETHPCGEMYTLFARAGV